MPDRYPERLRPFAVAPGGDRPTRTSPAVPVPECPARVGAACRYLRRSRRPLRRRLAVAARPVVGRPPEWAFWAIVGSPCCCCTPSGSNTPVRPQSEFHGGGAHRGGAGPVRGRLSTLLYGPRVIAEGVSNRQ